MSLVAELQQKVEAQEMLILDARKQNDLLKAENAKLRELVRDMRACCDHECGSCRYGDFMYCRALIDARARELGIEVDA